MAFIGKTTPGESSTGHVWKRAGEIIEVADEKTAAELLRIPGFFRAEAPPLGYRGGAPKRTPLAEIVPPS
jgi:hypothetical protein